ncbi:NAD(P)-dependent oxidoreductase [Acinetobacter nectaris]|uniref:NAD(P)-dependent oxidoreductase n=1 Tax=Acinetobacter nectaris TaxID=1219382 RepID=UPI001F24819D|nr:NAD(P)-dependent oxidoreductase [Acinetobacter nectaris]MCF8999560.1 NAD(P)-dependent oxidoreductase [Acinetobacter nectaris]MCF9027202.1 NAD(P)-dependent oxidoreductase [Acinetobacter nectaris]
MKIAIIGASGMAGSRILNELVSRGNQVTAIARNVDKVEKNDAVTAKAVDIKDQKALIEVLKGHDAVISAVRFADLDGEALIDAVRESGVKRYLVVGGAGSLLLPDQTRLIDSPNFPQEYRSEAEPGCVYLDQLKQVQDLDWTFVSPSALFQPGERTGKFRIAKDTLISNEQGSQISAEDYAIAFVDALEKKQYIRERFTVGY